MAVTRATLRLVQQLRARVDTVTDQQARTLTGAWVQAWNDVATDLHAALLELASEARGGRVSRAAAARSERLTAALAAIGAKLQDLGGQTDDTVTSGLRQAVQDAADAQADIVGSQLPPGSQAAQTLFARADDAALDRIVERSTQRIHKETRPLARDAERAMKRELVRGVAVGDNPRMVARRIMVRAESRFNGGLTRALAIARTETLDAHRAATHEAWQAHSGLLRGWQWLATLDRRTCPACLAMNGTVHPLKEPGPLDHVNGRCTAVPATRSWRDLGFDLPEPESALPDARAWFDTQPDAVQSQIMGPARLALLRSGGTTWDDLAARHDNAGWRPSYQVRPVRDLGQARASAAA